MAYSNSSFEENRARVLGTGTTPTTGGTPGASSSFTANRAMVLARPQPTAISTPVQPVVKPKVSPIKKVATGVGKFIARTGVAVAQMSAETIDFTGDFIASVIENKIRNQPLLGVIPAAVTKEQRQVRSVVADKWKEFYQKTEGKQTEKVKQLSKKLSDIEFIKPSPDWVKSSTKEKLTTRLGETVLEIGPGLVASIGAYALNPSLGFALASGSVADEITVIAEESGVPKEKAQLLGLGTGLLVGFLDKIVPEEVFSPNQKKEFVRAIAIRVVKSGLKEAGTEMTQEGVQLLVEKTLRDDLGMDEATSRIIMSGLGGLIGGSSSQGIVSFINNTRSGDIAGIKPSEIKPVPEELPVAITKPAEKYTSALDFAKEEFGQPPTAKIGLVSADKITPRDLKEVDTASKKYLDIRNSLQKKGFTEPIPVEVEKGAITTVEGSHRVVAARELGIKVPIIVTKGDLPELKTIEQVYAQIAKVSPIQPKAVSQPTERVAEPVKVAAREVSVPRAQLPIGEGKEKVSRLAARMSGALDTMSEAEIKKLGTPTFQQMNKKETIQKAAEYVTANPQEAVKVITGEIEPPEGLNTNSIYVAFTETEDLNLDLATTVASFASTAAGQNISILTELDPSSPIKLMGDIIKVREKAVKRRLGERSTKTAVEEEIAKIEKTVRIPDKYDWNVFLNSIKCAT